MAAKIGVLRLNTYSQGIIFNGSYKMTGHFLLVKARGGIYPVPHVNGNLKNCFTWIYSWYIFWETKVKTDKNVDWSSRNDPQAHFWAILDHFLPFHTCTKYFSSSPNLAGHLFHLARFFLSTSPIILVHSFQLAWFLLIWIFICINFSILINFFLCNSLIMYRFMLYSTIINGFVNAKLIIS